MRRSSLALFASLLAGTAVSLVATPAGAAGHASGVHTTSPVTPLTSGYFETFGPVGSRSYLPAKVLSVSDPSGVGTTLEVSATATIPGLSATSVIVDVRTNTSAPLTVGQTYGTGLNPPSTVDIHESSSTCPDHRNPEAASAQIDQLTETGGVVTSAAVQIVCAGANLPRVSLTGALAFQAVPTTPHTG